MHVVLVGPELEENLALRYLRGALEAEHHRVTQVTFDAPADLERAAAEIAASGAEIAGLSMVYTRRAHEFADLATRTRALGFAGLSVAGGHFAAFHAERLLADVPAIDLVAVGEGERILCDLARAPQDLGRIAGLVWRDGETLRRNAPAMPEQDLDALPWPTHKRPFDRYLGLPIANMLGSRGCSHACGFCSIAAWHKLCGGARYRARSAGNIAAEMGCLWREGVRLFNFHDDNFLGRDRSENLARVSALRDELGRQQVGKLAFQIKARPDAIDPELFALLRSMGLFRVFLGIEAGTELSLANLGRGQRLGDNVRALEILNGLDLHVAFNLLVLNPESTFEDFADNVAFLRQHPHNPMNFCRTEIYAGTPLEQRLRRQGRLFGDYWGLDYAIKDERAQLAFELFRNAFFERNFGAHPLHYLSGQVDYEHQLRMDFYGTTPELRAAAKDFVRAVNDNTASHLEQVLAVVRRGEPAPSFARELGERVAADDVRLHAEGQRVLERLRQMPERSPKKRAGRPHAAVAATVALALASCSSRGTPHAEAAPEPPPPTTGAPPDTAPTTGPVQTAPMEAAPYPPPMPILDAGAGPANAHPDAGGVLVPTYPTQVREAAPPPPPVYTGPPSHMEAAPRWDPNDPTHRR